MTNENMLDLAELNRWWILLVSALAVFFINLDNTIVNIAIPSILAYFKTDLASMEWVLNAYVLVFAGLLITFGRLGDIWGRKKMFVTGLVVFVAGSAACSFAPSIGALIGFRVLQALGGSMMMPATLSLVTIAFTRKGRGMAFGIWGASAGVAAAVGPTLGGVLIEHYSWHWIFLINVPFGLIVAGLAAWKLVESIDHTTPRKLDWPGVATISLALAGLTFALVEGQKLGWGSLTVIGIFVFAAVMVAVFILLERRASAPLINLPLFRHLSFTGGNLAGLIMMFSMLGVLFLLTLNLQLTLGYGPIQAGLALTPFPLMALLVAPFAGRFSDRIGGRWLVFAGFMLSAVGIYLIYRLPVNISWEDLVLPLCVFGAGLGLVMSPVTSAAMADVPAAFSGSASGILSTSRQIGSVLGISVVGAVFQATVVNNLKTALAGLNLPPPVLAQITAALDRGDTLSRGSNALGAMGSSMPQVEAMFRQQLGASVSASFIAPLILCLVGAVVALVMFRRPKAKAS